LNKDLVSVIIPIYNCERFLEQSINSVLNQTWNNIEVIVIDDGSTDNSLAILKKYSNRIKILTQSNQGLATSLKNGISKMNGYWFKWFSPDDILDPHAIEILINEGKKQPPNTIIYSNWDIINENGGLIRSFSESNYNNLNNFLFNVRLLDGQQINVNTTLIPSSLFDKGCVFQELEDPIAIDYDFFLRAAMLFGTSFYLIQKPLVKYRIHEDQLSHKKITSSLAFLPKVHESILSQVEKSKRTEYLEALKKCHSEKPISKKTLELGLNFITKVFPEGFADKLLVFYLNKIRSSR